MADIESIEIIDAQIHEPWPPNLPEANKPDLVLFQVELAREAIDAVGVDMALAVTEEAFIELAHQRYPGRFPGVPVISHTHPDMASEVRRVRANLANVAARALVGNYVDAVMRPEFERGDFAPLYAEAERVGLPIFNSTHGGCGKLAPVAEKHPNLTLIIDHIGVAQHPVSPPEAMSWGPFEDLMQLARFPNVCVKLCGAPLLSDRNYPFDDVWPYMERLFAAFGFDRVMWASDYTRMRIADRPKGERPRKRGLSYADSLNWLLRTGRIGLEDKRKLLGGSARRLLNLPPVAQTWGPPPMRS